MTKVNQFFSLGMFLVDFCKWFFLKYQAVILNLNNETTPGLRLRLGNLMKGTTSLRLLVSLTRENSADLSGFWIFEHADYGESSLDVTFHQLQNFLDTNSLLFRSEHVRFDGRAFGMEYRRSDYWMRRF
ncbi:unnamed protein product [Rhizophagus irregularis]|nr:unnamed protein product [Rhizophagus irregularis]